MKFLVVGSGGREHAIIHCLKRASSTKKIFCLPGNAGIANDVECVNIPMSDHEAIADFARLNKIDYVIIGPEIPLCEGLSDLLNSREIKVFGPSKEAAQLEGSKVFAKKFMDRYKLPTANWAVFENQIECIAFVEDLFAKGTTHLVVKADGLAAGKGVVVASSKEEALKAIEDCFSGHFGEASLPVLIEECLVGEEMSVLAFVDGKTIKPLASAQDYKRLYDGDKGPNTGGMGTSSPAPNMTPELEKTIHERVLTPFLRGIQTEKFNFHGIIFIGLMITASGPQLLEFNVRFGDPETQVILSRLKTDLGLIIAATVNEKLANIELEWDSKAAVCVVMASGGYPEKYTKNHPILGLQKVSEMADVKVFHAGTSFHNGEIVNTGGRVLGVTALGTDIKKAAERAYDAVKCIHWQDCIYRCDIGSK